MKFTKKVSYFISIITLVPLLSFGQSLQDQLKSLESKFTIEKEKLAKLEGEIENIKLNIVQSDLEAKALPKLLPGEKLIKHSALTLVYSEEHEQAKWVAHIIRPEIINGNQGRSNDFRTDPLVETGTAVEEDYFLKFLQADSTYKYDGFGYDRGHLAPSADFRWSKQALSESYFYSNMSPQVAKFNRGAWADLESRLRGYIYNNPTSQVYVVTGPVLKKNLDPIERSINKVSIPEEFFKIAVDLEKQKAIAFIMPNQKINYPLSHFATSVDRVEELTGIDFFEKLDEGLETEIERRIDLAEWLPEFVEGNVKPIRAPSLAPDHFNTVQAKAWMEDSKKVNICGTVVSSRRSSKGNILLNLDKKFPDQVFTVFVRKENIINFAYDPEFELKSKKICVYGKVVNLGGTPAMFIENEKQLTFFDQTN